MAMEHLLKHLISAALALAATFPLHAATLTADDVLEAAAGYTVKIKRTSGIGLNEDSGSSAHATGFLVDKQRGCVLTNAHVASRSPTTLSVSFMLAESSRHGQPTTTPADRIGRLAIKHLRLMPRP
jgi:hypothetical protein